MPALNRSRSILVLAAAALSLLALALACGGGGTGPSPATMAAPTSGSVAVLVTDAPSDNWADIGVLVRKVVLLPTGGGLGDGITVYDGAGDGASINLVHLDELGELLGTLGDIPPGSYDRVLLRVDGNPGKVTLVPGPDASGAPQPAIPAGQISVPGVRDGNGWVVLPTLDLGTPLVVSAGATSALSLDFDLAHPLFIVVHDLTPTPVYTVDFQVRRKALPNLDQLYLRPFRGQAGSVAAASLVLRTVHGKDVTLRADSTGKTLFYDLDANPVVAVTAAAFPSGLTAGKYLRASARFQGNGSLTAVRVWYSADDSRIPIRTPEGHVLRVDAAAGQFRVVGEDGRPVTVAVDAGTSFTFQGGASAIGAGPGFLGNLGRGFKVQVSVADASLSPVLAGSVDIQHALAEGDVSAAKASGFTLARTYADGFSESRSFPCEAAFSWWNFAYPGAASSDPSLFAATALPAAGTLRARALAGLDWVSPAWAAKGAILLPTPLSTRPQTVTTAYANGVLTAGFIPDGAGLSSSVPVHFYNLAGGQALAYEYTRYGGVVTVTPLDVASWPAKFAAGARVRVYGIPRADGSLDAYVVNLLD